MGKKNKNVPQIEIAVTYDQNGPTLVELYHYPEVIALFEGILLTKKLLKPEFRSNRQPADSTQEDNCL